MKKDNPTPPAQLTPGRLLRISQFIPHFLPMAKSTFWKKVAAGTYPQPIKVSERVTCWKSEDIIALLNHKNQEERHAA
jgi:predicted DNA-binding transcriptional regulator AlpA